MVSWAVAASGWAAASVTSSRAGREKARRGECPAGDPISAGPAARLLSGVVSREISALGVRMWRSFGIGVLVITVASCRNYDLASQVTNQDGLVPADQYARYGREQAEEIAIAREFGHAGQGSSPEARRKQAKAATTYAGSLPDVVGVKADAQGLLLTVQFKSGWRTMVTPLNDGKRGAETLGLPAGAGAKGKR
jgi:hypothetical protein